MALFSTLRSAALSSLTLSDAVRLGSQNIANAENPNYHRHEVDFSTTDLNLVRIARVRRVTAEGLERRYTQQISEASYRSTLQRYTEELKIEAGLGGIASGEGDFDAPALDLALNRFERALRDLQASPESESAYNEFVAGARDFALQIRSSASSLQRLRFRLDDQIEQQTAEVNRLVGQLRDANARVARTRNAGQGEGAENQREEILRNIAERISLQVLEDDKGAKNLYLQNGRALLLGGITNELRYDRGSKQFTLNVDSDVVANDDVNRLGPGSLTALFDLVREGATSRISTDEDVALIAKYEDQLESLARAFVSGSVQGTAEGAQSTSLNDVFHLSRVQQLRERGVAQADLDDLARRDLFVATGASANNLFRFTVELSREILNGNSDSVTIGSDTFELDLREALETADSSRNILSAFQLAERNFPPAVQAENIDVALGGGTAPLPLPPSLRQENQNYYGLVQGISVRLNDVVVAYDDRAVQQRGTREELQVLLSNFVGVNLDEEFLKISQLQRTFAANARVIVSVQEMLDDLLASV